MAWWSGIAKAISDFGKAITGAGEQIERPHFEIHFPGFEREPQRKEPTRRAEPTPRPNPISDFYISKADFIEEYREEIYRRTRREANDDQIESLGIMYDEYTDEEGYIPNDIWDRNGRSGAWYFYLTEILGYPEYIIDRYVTH